MNPFKRFLQLVRQPSSFLKLVKAMPDVPEPQEDPPTPPPTTSTTPVAAPSTWAPSTEFEFGYGRSQPSPSARPFSAPSTWTSIKKDEDELCRDFLVKLFQDGYEVRAPTPEAAEDELQSMVETIVEEFLRDLSPKHQSYISTYRSWCWKAFRQHDTQVQRQFVTVDPALRGQSLSDLLGDESGRGNGTFGR